MTTPKGYRPQQGERQLGFITPETNPQDKSVRRKSVRLATQGKMGLGFRHIHEGETGLPFTPHIGIPHGKRTLIFRMHEGEPVVAGMKEHLGGGMVLNDMTYRGVAKLRAQFARLPEAERGRLLRKAREGLDKLHEEQRQDIEKYPYSKENFEEYMHTRMHGEPSEAAVKNCELDIEAILSVGELDVAWESHSIHNEKLRRMFQADYERKRRELIRLGALEPK